MYSEDKLVLKTHFKPEYISLHFKRYKMKSSDLECLRFPKDTIIFLIFKNLHVHRNAGLWSEVTDIMSEWWPQKWKFLTFNPELNTCVEKELMQIYIVELPEKKNKSKHNFSSSSESTMLFDWINWP